MSRRYWKFKIEEGFAIVLTGPFRDQGFNIVEEGDTPETVAESLRHILGGFWVHVDDRT